MMPATPRLLLLLLACLLPVSLAADERILDYRSDIRVESTGELLVTEIIRVRAEGRDIRRGIYRDFPTRYRDRWGNHVTASFDPLAVRRNGQAEPWHSERRSNGVRVYFGSADRLLEPGIHEYEFRFVTNRQLGFFDDHDELYFKKRGQAKTEQAGHQQRREAFDQVVVVAHAAIVVAASVLQLLLDFDQAAVQLLEALIGFQFRVILGQREQAADRA